MYIAMNRFKIKPGCEQAFIDIWKNRETHLDSVVGFKEFHLAQGPSHDDHTLFASHTTWNSKQDFTHWTESEQFRKAHAGAGGKSREIYLGPPQFEGFETVI
ncbi:MAG: antibiotic biosynthesis monooxygenase [Gammaproteobacteria bacterium]|nr:antibiotic biosynthesis monooxygenase [Gammaproteobacteria bacterium]MCF6229802.1 antibiotic biosynthesis monooxygenase [Gammaproteobacteria bacterium]